MKKFVFILMLLVSSFLTFAQTGLFQVTEFYIKFNDETEWSKFDITDDFLIFTDFAENHIEIYSNKTQIIDYVKLEMIEFNSGTLYASYATDTDYSVVYLEFICYAYGDEYIQLTYPHVMYKYKVIPVQRE